MKKIALLLVILMGSAAFGSGTMLDGEYQGVGRWQDSLASKGSYNIDVTVKSGVVSSTYVYSGKTDQYEFTVSNSKNGNFDVLVGGKKAGQGYCLSVQCHYEVSFGGTELEETLTFYDGNLYRIGSKKVNGKTVIWEESMRKIN